MRWLLAGLAVGAMALLAACAPARNWPEPSPALWEVRAPDGARGWLFGTIHALPDGVEWRTPALEQALAGSRLLVVEVAELGDAEAAAAEFARRSRTSGLPPLLARVPAEERAALASALEIAELEERAFAEIESWAAALQIASALRRSDTGNGVDRALIDQAERVIGLESFGEQFALFDRLPPAEQASLLVTVAHEAGADEQDARTEAWLTGDLDALAREAAEGLLADPVLRERLQLARNRAWAEQVETLVATGERPFVAVGAAHMLGREGLPALLAARGYEVHRIQ